jgi:diguanylate cyclase (GGDEF)-like protein
VLDSHRLENDLAVERGGAVGAPQSRRVAPQELTVVARLARWLRGDPLAFSDRPLAPLELERVRLAQSADVRRGARVSLVALVLGATTLPIGMWNSPARAPLIAWVLLLAAHMLISRAFRRRASGRCADPALAAARDFRLATIQAIGSGALWGCGFVLAQAYANAGQRALIATLSMSTMSGGALQLATTLPMAYGFVAPVALGCVLGVVLRPDAIALPVVGIQLFNAGFLLIQAHFQATQLARRTIAHFADEVAARVDPLTGLGNRRAFNERLAAAFERLEGGGQGFALMCFDLDRFKLVNDTFGHVAGDEVIVRAARALRQASRENDFVARLGGDEFALIAPEMSGRAAAEALAQDVVAEFRRPFAFDWGDSACSVSVGVALAPDHGEDGDRLVRNADAALYKAKQIRRGSIAFVDEAESGEARERRELETALRQALRNGEMRLDFQPLIDVASGATKGFEALLRWRRPGFGDLPASLFIPAAEECGCIEEIGVWALREAARIAASWPRRLRVAVNVSATQLKSPTLAAAIREIVETRGFDPRRLELEIKEPSFIADFEAAAASLNALRRLGVTVALDDFGAGYSSMTSIARLPLDRIKIDRAFVVDALANPRCAAVIRAAARLARELGLALTGEGVETCEQFDLLRSAGCDEVHGYLFSRPLPVDALASVFERCPAPLPPPAPQAGGACGSCTLPWCAEAGMCRRLAAAG